MKIKSGIAGFIVCCLLCINNAMPVLAQERTPVVPDFKGSFAEKSFTALAEQGMIDGIGTERLRPGQEISRAQFTVLMAKVLGVQPLFPRESIFRDLSSPLSLADGYAEAMARLKIIQGADGLNLGGNSPVQRQDAAVIIYRALGDKIPPPALKGKYKDETQISSYAVNSVAYVTAKGWMNGSGGRFFPLRDLTYAEAAVLADHLLKFREDQALGVLRPEAGHLNLGSGETRELGIDDQSSPVAFTPVFGTDNPDLWSVSPGADTMISGNQPGTGIMTVNTGGISSSITVDVSNDKVGEVASTNSASLTPPNSASELAVKYKVAAQSPDASYQKLEYKGYSGPVEGLASKSDTWTGFLRQKGRDITVDLGALQSISSVSMEFKQDVSAGVNLPKYMEASLSADGQSWYQMGHVFNGADPADKTVKNVTLALTFPPVVTRYLKISFPVDVLVFVRHLSIKKGFQSAEPVILAPSINDSGSIGTYLYTSALQDILLVYTGDKSDIKTLNPEKFWPLVAYLGPQGEIKGRMFDAIQFMPYTGMPCTKADWLSYLEDLFAPGQQLPALDETMAKLNAFTGKQGKEKVILTLPYPDNSQSDFGTLEPEGKTVSFAAKSGSDQQAVTNRLNAVKWYYGELMKRWNGKRFAHLELAGIYWYKESMDPSIGGEAELVQNVAGMVHSNNQNFIWIPFFGAPGVQTWKDYGFNYAFLQPTYYSSQDQSAERMDRAAAIARQYGTGIELECDNRILTTRYYYDLFYHELDKAHELGLDGRASNAYYVGFAQTLLDAAHSDIPQIRKIYDDIYRWINGTYK